MSNLSHVVQAVYGSPWFIEGETFEKIKAVVQLHVDGVRLSPEEIKAQVATAVTAADRGPRRGGGMRGTVAVIPIYGIIMPRATLMSEYSGGTAVQGLTRAFREALDDESVGSILFEVDSPGGQVDGIEELATEIRAARGRKPMVAIANITMASAAYYLACQADEVVATPSGMVGSIGCLMAHTDTSAAEEKLGLKTTVISAGKYKAETHGPLTDEARAHLQERVNDYNTMFVNAVAKARGVSAAAVRGGYGEGRALTAARAKDAGLVDRIDTFDATIRRLATGKGPASRGVGAEASARIIAAIRESGPAETDPARVQWLLGSEESAGDEPEPDAAPAEEPAATADDHSTELELRRLKHRTRSRV
jgi:signal peptide peptidase SppA